MRFYVESDGRFSGGGTAVLNNCAFAAERHQILQGSAEAGDVPFVMRNVPARGSKLPSRYVLGPQNALPWTRFAKGPREWLLLSRLRVASEWYARRALAVFRTSSAVPAFGDGVATSPVLHNVLDLGFEEAVAQAADAYEPASGHIVSMGSGHSYRNLFGLLEGYGSYRESGGTLPLFIGGSPGGARIRAEVERAAAALPEVRIQWGAIPRPQFLAALRDSPAVVLPSLVEASPLSALEACALTPRVVMSDIIGHREILDPFVGGPGADPAAFFDVTDAASLGRAIQAAADGGRAGNYHAELASPDRREQAREDWSAQLAQWLEQVSAQASAGGKR